MRAVPYLNFDGTCAEAFRLYEKVLGGRIETMMTHGESPIADQVPPAWRDLILHVYLVAGDAVLMGSDSPPGHHRQPGGFAVALQMDDRARAERIFQSLSEGGTVTMPLEPTFWAERFGMLVDRFGTPWMINCAPAPVPALRET